MTKGKEVVQASSDSADGRHPIATVTIGAARDLIFSRQERRGGWKKSATEITTFELGQNSLFVLLPWKDEVPMKHGGTMRRKVHEATFRGKGVSIAMVFRRVNEQMTGRFGRDSGLWVFDEESTPGKFLKRNEREFNKITAIGRRPEAQKAMGAIAKRVIRVLEENAREVRKTKKKQIGRKQA